MMDVSTTQYFTITSLTILKLILAPRIECLRILYFPGGLGEVWPTMTFCFATDLRCF